MAISANSILADATGEELPAPVAITIGEEIIWSSKTGRTASGKMVGKAIAEKETVNITWGVLTKQEIRQIEEKMPKGFIKVYVMGDLMEVYRGTLNKEAIGKLSDGLFYFKSASTDIVER